MPKYCLELSKYDDSVFVVGVYPFFEIFEISAQLLHLTKVVGEKVVNPLVLMLALCQDPSVRKSLTP